MAKFKFMLGGPKGEIDVSLAGDDEFIQALFPVISTAAEALLNSEEIAVENLDEVNAEMALAAEAISTGHNFRGEVLRFSITKKK